MHRWLMGVVVVVASCVGFPASAQSNGGNGQTIRCESTNNRTQNCQIDARGDVRLVRTLSDSPCVEGRSWGVRGNNVWVSGGCRAEFAANGYDRRADRWRGRNDGGLVTCESVDNRTNECRVDTRGGVRLVRKLSDNACTEGRNWGYHADRIWVSGGCRAQFEVGRGGSGGGNSGGQLVRCESNDRRTVECPADTRGGVQLERKLSDTQCTQGQTWGYHRNSVWVSGGCRAEFRIGGGGYSNY